MSNVKFTGPKLVRDKIPAQALRRGDPMKTRKAGREELPRLLLEKVLEETVEVLNAVGAARVTRKSMREAVMTEFPDLVDAVEEVKKHFKLSAREINHARTLKRRRKGGFEQRLVWIG